MAKKFEEWWMKEKYFPVSLKWLLQLFIIVDKSELLGVDKSLLRSKNRKILEAARHF